MIANAWMNAPTGFDLVDGRLADIDPIAGMLNPVAFQQTLHMTLAAYAATGLRGRRHPRLPAAASTATTRSTAARWPSRCWSARPAAVLQPLSGDLSARAVAEYQPAKLAAMEAHFETERRAPLVIGGWPDVDDRRDPLRASRFPTGSRSSPSTTPTPR